MDRQRVITFIVLAFLAVGVISGGSAGYSVYRIEQQLTGNLEVHTDLYARILVISQSYAEVVQESFAYLLSGDPLEKDEALQLHALLKINMQAFAEATHAHAHAPPDGAERALINSIARNLEQWSTLSTAIFREYETAGAVAPETFSVFEASIDETGLQIARMVAIERSEMEAASSETIAVIAKAEQLIWTQAILLILVTLLAATVVARALHRVFSNRELLQAQLLQSQKMEVVGQLAGGIAHDFNNYLTVISGAAHLIGDGDKVDVKHWSAQIAEAGDRAAALTSQLLAFARKQVLDPTDININTVIEATSPLLRRTIGENIDLEFVPADDIGIVKVDRSQLEQVIVNLVLNARDAMPEGGTITIETGAALISDEFARSHPGVIAGNHAMLAVSDTGTGIDPTIRDKIFEPFATTKDVGKGTGLGLSTVYGIVTQNGGTISVYSEPGHGSTFKVYFRCVTVAATSGATEPGVARALGRGVVLLVEDDEMVRGVTRAMLERIGFEVIEAEDGVAGLDVLRQRQDFALLLTDITMPNMGGIDLANGARKILPDLKVLYMSGYTQNGIVHHGRVDSGSVLLQKPFTFNELNHKLIEVLG